MQQTSSTAIEKKRKCGVTEDNTGTNRKAKGIEMNRTAMTKTKHKPGKRLMLQKSSQTSRKEQRNRTASQKAKKTNRMTEGERIENFRNTTMKCMRRNQYEGQQDIEREPMKSKHSQERRQRQKVEQIEGKLK
jgi:hypothetical protein